MKTIATITFSILILLFISCGKNSATVISSDVDITLLNEQGQNLLASPAAYTKNTIDVFYIVNGQPQLYNQPNLTYDKGFNLINEGTSRIRVFLNHDVNRKEPIALTLIKFGSSKTDTIKGEFEFTNSSVFLRKVWFNGVLKSREFSAIK